MMSELPEISVIIPNLNNSARLKQALDRFSKQDYPYSKLEIIVVDNGSTDDSLSVARKLAHRVISEITPSNPYKCRNLGIQQSRYQLLLLSDSTCVPAREYVSELYNKWLVSDADLIAGNIKFEVSRIPTLGEMVNSIRFMRNHEFADIRKTYPAGSLFFHRSLIDRVGLFREDMRSAADFDWTIKVHNSGARITCAENAVVYYPGITCTSLLKKAHRDGWALGTLARENGDYSLLDTMLRFRPPSPRHFRYVLKERADFNVKGVRLKLWFGLWCYRIFFNLGRLHVLSKFPRD